MREAAGHFGKALAHLQAALPRLRDDARSTLDHWYQPDALLLAPLATICAAAPLRLENDKLVLCFDAASGTLTAVENKLSGETYNVSGDGFAIEAVQGDTTFATLKAATVKLSGETLDARYEGATANRD